MALASGIEPAETLRWGNRPLMGRPVTAAAESSFSIKDTLRVGSGRPAAELSPVTIKVVSTQKVHPAIHQDSGIGMFWGCQHPHKAGFG